MLFDSHAHYYDEQFDADRDELLIGLPAAGVSAVVTCPSTPEQTSFSRNLAEKYPHVYFASGIHPEDCGNFDLSALTQIEEFAAHPKCVAIGEIGLDYHWMTFSKEVQKEWFQNQILLAKKLNLPVIVHDREAHADTFELLAKHLPSGVLHCFSGGAELAREYVKRGFYISFAGTLTFKNNRRSAEAAAAVPLDRLLIETDAPYLSPEPERGKRNDSRKVKYTCEKLAEIKGISAEEMAEITLNNACRLFGIKR